jgi:hypothetical protein
MRVEYVARNGAVAAVLKVVGVSKVRSQTVQQRTRESNAYLEFIGRVQIPHVA